MPLPSKAEFLALWITLFKVRVPPLGFVRMSLVVGSLVVIPREASTAQLADERAFRAVASHVSFQVLCALEFLPTTFDVALKLIARLDHFR